MRRADTEEPTPVEIPNGIPKSAETSGEIKLAEGSNEPDPPMPRVARASLSLVGGGEESKEFDIEAYLKQAVMSAMSEGAPPGGNGPSPGDVVKKLKSGHLVISLLIFLFGGGGLVYQVYGNDDRSKANAESIEKIDAELDALSERLGTVEVTTEAAKEAVKSIREDDIPLVVKAVGDLKSDVLTTEQKRTQAENARLREENARLRQRNRASPRHAP